MYLFFLILIACIPAGLIGIFFKDLFTCLFCSVFAVGMSMMVTGTLLLLTKFVRDDPDRKETLGWAEALVIAAGGVYGAEGAAWLGITGTDAQVNAADMLIQSVVDEPAWGA